MTNRKRFLLLGMFAFSTAFAGGPVYTRYAYGDLLFYNGSRAFALGGGGLALLGDNFISRLNPASLSQITRTRFSAGFDFAQYSSESGSGASKFNLARFHGAAIRRRQAPPQPATQQSASRDQMPPPRGSLVRRILCIATRPGPCSPRRPS